MTREAADVGDGGGAGGDGGGAGSGGGDGGDGASGREKKYESDPVNSLAPLCTIVPSRARCHAPRP